MAYEERDGQGTLFVNTHKKQGEKTPDRRGTFTLNGVQYEIAAWERQGAKGDFLSLSVKPKDTHNHSRPGGHATVRPDSQPGDIDQRTTEEVPF